MSTGLDRYSLRRLLGVGGMGEVYLGVHRTIDKEVAIKVLSYEHRDDPRLNARFLDEAKAASKIRHENVVDITDFGHSPQGSAYFVMEYLEGEDLMTTLNKRGRLSWSRARHLVVQLLDALQAAHDHGVVHRDVKPGNCMRVTRGRDPDFLKVLDFGIARLSERHEGGDKERLTKSGTIIGTAQYMAPEQARGDDVDPRTDLYAVGVMLFELVTGHLPYDGRAAVEILAKHLYDSIPRASEVNPRAGLSEEIDQLLLRALAKDPNDRFDDATQMLEAIEAIDAAPSEDTPHPELSGTHVAGPTTILSEPASLTDPSHRNRVPARYRLPWALATGGTLLTIGAVAWLLVRNNGSTIDDSPCPEDMVLVPGGPFFMGTDEDSAPLQSGRPSHKVELAPYCMAVHEVTVAQFHECSDEGQCRRPFKDSQWPHEGTPDPQWERTHEIFSTQCNENNPGHRAHPVNCVTWEQARDYCEFSGRRLPTEAEWEYAARGSDGRVFPWGDAEPTVDHANLCWGECEQWRAQRGLDPAGNLGDAQDDWPGTAPVGHFPLGATQHGLHDVVGNVFEWTATEFELYEGHPKGLENSPGRVIRGGGHNSGYTMHSNPALRFPMDPLAHTHAIGFRCAADPQPD